MFGNREKKIEKCIEKQKVGPVLQMVNGKDETLLLKAIAALGQIACEESYNALITLLRDQRPAVRACAVRALGDLRDAKAKVHVIHLEKTEKDAAVLSAIHDTVGKLRSQD